MPQPAKSLALTAEFLRACDLVKFAKHVPESEDTRRTVELAYRLIDETRPRESAAEGVQAQAAAVGSP